MLHVLTIAQYNQGGIQSHHAPKLAETAHFEREHRTRKKDVE